MTASMPSRSTSVIVYVLTRERAQALALAGVERADADQDGAALVDRRRRPASARRSARRPSRARRSGPCRGRCPTASSPACCSRRARRTRSSRPARGRARARRRPRARASGRRPARAAARRRGSGPRRGRRSRSQTDEDLRRGTWRATSPSSSASIGSSATVPRSWTPSPRPASRPDEAGVADRGGPHVDAAATLPEVERGAEDGDRAGAGHPAIVSDEERRELCGERGRCGQHARSAGRRRPAAARRRRPPRARAGRPPRDPTPRGRARRRRRAGRRRPTRGRARPSRRGGCRAPGAARARRSPSAACAPPRT